jgi:tetratricopeptide (TPR) repeat protein
MDRTKVCRRYGLAAAAILAVLGLVTPGVKAADDVDWKARALALNEITGEKVIEGQIKMLLEDPAGAKKLVEAALPLLKEKEQPFNYNAAYILARVALQVKDLEGGQAFFRVCAEKAAKLRSPQKLVQAYSGMLGIIDLLYLTKKYEASAKLCQEFLETLEREGFTRAVKEDVLRRMIRAMAKQGKVDEAAKMVENLLKVRSGDWRNLELKAWLEREAGRDEAAIKIYEELLEEVAKDKALEKAEKDEIVSEIHYILSGLYVDVDRVDKAADHLKILLGAHPDNPTYNNDLGYIWADHDMNLDEAERMIRKALDDDRKQRDKNPELKPEENKDNAAYLDSLGWVLYKQKKYKEAIPVLERAVEDKEGQHIEIFDHLAEVYMAVGEKAKALDAWKKGVEAAGSSKREQERKAQVEKKLQASK